MTIEPGSLGNPTSADIKAAWDAHPDATSRSVRDAMVAEGWQISDRTIGRTVARGFAPLKYNKKRYKAAAKTSPEINAVNQVKSGAPPDAPAAAIAEAMLEAIRNLPPGEKDRVKELLGVDDQELDNRALKLVKVGRVLLAEDFAQHTKMMMLMPDKAAKLYVALGTNLMIAPPSPDGGDSAKIIVEHNPNEPKRLSPSAQAIADFRAKRGSVAA